MAVTGVFGLFVSSLVGMHGFFAVSNRTTCKPYFTYRGMSKSAQDLIHEDMAEAGLPFQCRLSQESQTILLLQTSTLAFLNLEVPSAYAQEGSLI